MSSINNDISQLKKIILDTAIRGKLVPQDENDEDAGVLLEKIKAEKEKLIKEGKIKKDKPLPEIIPEEIPFEIPKSWRWVRFNDYFDFQGGSQPPKSHFSSDLMPNYVRLFQIRDFGKKPQPIYVDKSSVSKFFQENDVLLARYGASLGKVFIANQSGAYNVAIAKVIDDKKLTITKYLYYFFVGSIYQTFIKLASRSAQAGFNKGDFERLLFPLPPKPEQQRIVAKIESLFKLADEIDSRRISLAEKVKQLKSAILQEAITGKLVPQDKNDEDAGLLLEKIKAEKEKLIKEGKIKKDKPLPEIKPEEIPFEIPKNWRWVRLGQISEYIQRGKSPKYSDKSEQLVISQKCIRWDKIDYSVAKTIDPGSIIKYEEIRFLKDGDILWNSTGTGTLGRASLFHDFEKFPKLVVDSHVTIVRLLNALPQFIYSLIRSDWVQNNLKSSGSTNQIELNTGSIKNQLIPLPPIKEQHRIVYKIETLFEKIDQLEQKLYQSKELTSKLNEAILNKTLES